MDTFARVGERAGAMLGSGLHTARVQATRAGRQLGKQLPQHTTRTIENARRARDSAQAALAEVVAEYWGPALETLAERWGVTQDVLADRLHEARHELAARIEPPPPPRHRRWPWLILLFLGIIGAIGAVVLARRPQQVESDRAQPQSLREPGSRDSDPDHAPDPYPAGDPDSAADPDATGAPMTARDPKIGGFPAGNGIVGVERPSPSTD